MTVNYDDSRSDRIERIISDLNISALYGVETDDELWKVLTTFKDTTFDLIERTIAWNKKQGIPRFGYMHMVLTECSEQVVREQMFHRANFPHDLDSHEAIAAINGLGCLDHFRGHRALDALTGEDLEIAKAFLALTATIHEYAEPEAITCYDVMDNDNNTLHIASRDLQAIITGNADHAASIAMFIRDRRTADHRQLRDYLDDGTVLKDGVL